MPVWLIPIVQFVLRYWRPFALAAAAFACFLAGFVQGCSCRRRVGEDVPPAKVGSFGWINDPARVRQVLATLPHPFFKDVGSHLIRAAARPEAEQDALLYQCAVKVTGKVLPAHDQDGTGCCVGEGTTGALELAQCVNIALDGRAATYKPVSAAATYALAREVGGYLGQGDGSTGADAAKAITTLGTVSCEDAKDDNTTGTPHARLAKKWGASGLPKDLKALAKNAICRTASQVDSAEEIRAALLNGYPVMICSDVGFEGKGGFKRDADGFCYPGGSWPHCMYVAGYRKDRKAFLIIQSWGQNVPPGPKTLDQPDCSFWIEWSAMERIARQRDSYALSSYDGFPARELDWIVQKPVRNQFVVQLRDGFHEAGWIEPARNWRNMRNPYVPALKP